MLQVICNMLHCACHMITLPLADQGLELARYSYKTGKARYSSIKLKPEQEHLHCSALSSNGPYRNCLSALQLLDLGSAVQTINGFTTVCSVN